jgi:hypothetical protein
MAASNDIIYILGVVKIDQLVKRHRGERWWVKNIHTSLLCLSFSSENQRKKKYNRPRECRQEKSVSSYSCTVVM